MNMREIMKLLESTLNEDAFIKIVVGPNVRMREEFENLDTKIKVETEAYYQRAGNFENHDIVLFYHDEYFVETVSGGPAPYWMAPNFDPNVGTGEERNELFISRIQDFMDGGKPVVEKNIYGAYVKSIEEAAKYAKTWNSNHRLIPKALNRPIE